MHGLLIDLPEFGNSGIKVIQIVYGVCILCLKSQVIGGVQNLIL
jgi:hypothetical protein